MKRGAQNVARVVQTKTALAEDLITAPAEVLSRSGAPVKTAAGAAQNMNRSC